MLTFCPWQTSSNSKSQKHLFSYRHFYINQTLLCVLSVIRYCKDHGLLVKYGNLVISFNFCILENATLHSLICIETNTDPTNETLSLASHPKVAKVGCFTKNHASSHTNESNCEILYQGIICLFKTLNLGDDID